MWDNWRVFVVAGGILAGIFAMIGVAFLPAWQKRRNEALMERGRTSFRRRREWLEARFLTLAEQSGKPRGLRWTNCEFDDDVAFARDRRSGRPRALVAVTISFEAIPGGGMEEVEAVGNLRAATVVFRLDGPGWETDGKACYNLSPAQTIDYYHNELETVE
ncbi:MAG: hypothetical protein QF918_11685 [Pirellulaceae bacterium]|jgi:hypothetical protein|nr:hypothetical protein [Pirellulaceae bacterium]MDP6554835.1 hypothetical protein [Pirellulaceae bacterium]